MALALEPAKTTNPATQSTVSASAAPPQGAVSARISSSDAFDRIERILSGLESPADLTELFSAIDASARNRLVLKDLERLSVLSGDEVLEATSALEAPRLESLQIVLRAREAPSAPRLQRAVAVMHEAELAALTPAEVEEIRRVSQGDLFAVIPAAQRSLSIFVSNEAFLKWLVQTTPHQLTAFLMSRFAASSTADALNRIDGGWSWVEALNPRDCNAAIQIIGPKSNVDGVPDAIASLAKQVQHISNNTSGPHGDAGSVVQSSQAPVALVMSRPAHKLGELLDALPGSGRMTSVADQVVATDLLRLGATAVDLLRVEMMGVLDHHVCLDAILNTRDVSPALVATFLAVTPRPALLLSDDRLRTRIRALIPGIRARDLVDWGQGQDMKPYLASVGIRRWIYETSTPAELLVLCTSDLAASSQMIRMVGADIGFDWVRQLPNVGVGRDAKLREFALNCHDVATVRFVREVLMVDGETPDPKVHTAGTIGGGGAADPRTRAGESGRLLDALAASEATPAEVMDRLVDLDPATRVRMAGSDELVSQLARRLAPETFARAAYLLDLTFARALRACPPGALGMLEYLRGRPLAEELAVVPDAALVQRAASDVHPNLLLVFPSLNEAGILAAVLERNPVVLSLLLAGSDPNKVEALLSREPVRSQAAHILDVSPALRQRLPHGTLAPPVGVSGPGAERHEAANPASLATKVFSLAAEREASSRSDRPLAEQLEGLRVSGVSALALLEANKQQVSALLFDRRNWLAVDQLARLVQLPPDIAIPWIGVSELLQMPNAVFWWLSYADGATFLRRLGTSANGRAVVGKALDGGDLAAFGWIAQLPRGAALDRGEQLVLDQLNSTVKTSDALRAVFTARFGLVPPAAFQDAELSELYAIVSRLPAGQIDQGRIHAMAVVPQHGGAGAWNPGTKTIELDPNTVVGKRGSDFYPEDMQDAHTLAEMTALYGFDQAELDRRRSSIEVLHDKTGVKYRVRPEKMELFSQVVLHEIGHSVDEILGNHSAVVWDFAGWHEYDFNGFDAWAAEMGGWDRVSAGDREQIRIAWMDSIHAQVAVASLVGPDHPAVAAKYKGVGIVELAGELISGERRAERGGRVYIINNTTPGNRLYSLKASAAHSAPSQYSLTAPGEYFAESYVEYYRGVDGSAGSTAKKGGMLPSAVKKWFDENVDKLKYDPHRFEKEP